MEEISTCHIWRATTGGGPPVDYLNWLAAMWTHYRYSSYDGVALAIRLEEAGIADRYIGSHMREPFHEWLVAKFNAH